MTDLKEFESLSDYTSSIMREKKAALYQRHLRQMGVMNRASNAGSVASTSTTVDSKKRKRSEENQVSDIKPIPEKMRRIDGSNSTKQPVSAKQSFSDARSGLVGKIENILKQTLNILSKYNLVGTNSNTGIIRLILNIVQSLKDVDVELRKFKFGPPPSDLLQPTKKNFEILFMLLVAYLGYIDFRLGPENFSSIFLPLFEGVVGRHKDMLRDY